MCIYIYMYICTCTHTRVCVYVCVCLYVCIYIFTNIQHTYHARVSTVYNDTSATSKKISKFFTVSTTVIFPLENMSV